MRYKILLHTLRILIYIKRVFWWLGNKGIFVFAVLFSPFWKFFWHIWYKLEYFFKKFLAGGFNSQLIKRNYLQAFILIALFVVALPQTKIYASKDRGLPGQKTIARSFTQMDEDYTTEEVTQSASGFDTNIPVWEAGNLSQERFIGSGVSISDQDWSGISAGGLALTKPYIFPGGFQGTARDKIMEYIVEPGDTLGGISGKFDINIATVLWENNLTTRSFIRPGDKLRILPITGLAYTIKKGDILSRVASKYSANASDIIKFNRLKEDGSDLVIGEIIIIPNGIKPQSAIARAPSGQSAVSRAYTPPSSRQLPSTSGFIWPTAARVITQYFTWVHHALDIAGGNFSTPNYAAKAGVVEKAQCGWNSGYGCMIVIDHGGGVKTLYGHNSKLLVSPGESVSAGQTIALMGNTGKVRGRTGIHLHFEIIINGQRVNPLGYVR